LKIIVRVIIPSVMGRDCYGTVEALTIKLSELAKLANVSKTTASFVLNEEAERHGIKPETIRRVREVAAQHGYVPNQASRNLRQGRQYLIAFVAPQVTDSFFLTIAQSVEQTAETHGYQVLFGSTFSDVERERRYLESLIARRVDAIILLPTHIDAPHLDILLQHQIPTILFRRRHTSRKPFRFMTFNDELSAELATRHLVDQGCRRIGMVIDAVAEEYDWLQVIIEARVAGYRRALRAAGLKAIKPVILTPIDRQRSADDDPIALLRKHKIDGLVAMEDLCILRLINKLYDAGYDIPESIKLVGCDNSPYTAFLRPPLTSVGFPQAELGRCMIEELVEAINSGTAPRGELLLDPYLVPRASSAVC
jgi:LacI family transcriptional regulator